MTRSKDMDAAGVMAALEAGAAGWHGARGWQVGAMPVAGGIIDALVRADLVRRQDGRIVLAPAGHGFTARTRTPDAANRLLAEATIGSARRVTVNRAESPLGWLRARRMISDRQFDAGERLRADWEVAGLPPRVTMRWDAAPAGPRGAAPVERTDATTAHIQARRRFDAAIGAAGPGLADICWRVICAGEGLETAERAMDWPKRAGKLVLLMALDRLAAHYRISE